YSTAEPSGAITGAARRSPIGRRSRVGGTMLSAKPGGAGAFGFGSSHAPAANAMVAAAATIHGRGHPGELLVATVSESTNNFQSPIACSRCFGSFRKHAPSSRWTVTGTALR